jgi:hypothetical protein
MCLDFRNLVDFIQYIADDCFNDVHSGTQTSDVIFDPEHLLPGVLKNISDRLWILLTIFQFQKNEISEKNSLNK